MMIGRDSDILRFQRFQSAQARHVGVESLGPPVEVPMAMIQGTITPELLELRR
jgi:hypothetical protein